MDAAQQRRDEEHFRQVERALLYADDAARRIGEISAVLKKDDASPHLVAALETAADAVRADHRRLMKSVYFRAPGADQQELTVDTDNELLAS